MCTIHCNDLWSNFISFLARQISRLKNKIADLQEILVSTGVVWYWLPREEYGKYICKSQNECPSLVYCSNLQPTLGVQTQRKNERQRSLTWGISLWSPSVPPRSSTPKLIVCVFVCLLIICIALVAHEITERIYGMTSSAYGGVRSHSSILLVYFFCHPDHCPVPSLNLFFNSTEMNHFSWRIKLFCPSSFPFDSEPSFCDEFLIHICILYLFL